MQCLSATVKKSKTGKMKPHKCDLPQGHLMLHRCGKCGLRWDDTSSATVPATD